MIAGVDSILSIRSASGQADDQPLRYVTIEASEYAFHAPAMLSPGLVAFRFVNHGKVAHEVQLFRFDRRVSVKTARDYLATATVPDSAADPSGSVLIALPGVTAHEDVLVRLERGELYAMLCEFRDAPGKPKHSTLGMVGLLEVR